MTYRPAIGPGLGLPASSTPTVTCDGCGAVLRVVTRRGLPPKWLLDGVDGKGPPGWWMERGSAETGVKRRDLCPRCKP